MVAFIYAAVVQLIERFLAKEEVAGLSPVCRSSSNTQSGVFYMYNKNMKKTNWKKLFLGTLGFAAAYVVIMSILFLISLHILGYIFLIYGQFILIGVLAYHAAKRTLNDSKNSRRDTIIFGFLLFFTAVLCMQFLTPVYLVLQNIIGWGVEVNFVEELSQSFEWHRLLMTFLGTWGIGVLFAVLTGVGTWYRSNVYDSLPKNQKKSEDNSLDSIIKKLSISAILVVFPGIALYLFLIDYFFGDPSWDVLILIFVLPALVIGLFLTHIAKTTNNKKLAVFLGIATLIWVLGIYGYGILERYNSTNGDDEIKLEDAGKLQSSTDSDYTDWPDADAYVQGYSYFDSQIVENSSIHYAVKFANEEIANIAQQYIDQNKLATFIYTTQSRGFGGEKYKRYWNATYICHSNTITKCI